MAATVCIAVIAALFAGCGDGGRNAESSAIQRPGPLDSLAKHVSLLRSPQGLGDVPPPAVLPREIAAQVGLSLKSARLARSYQGDPIYVVASPSLVCTYSRNRTIGNCWSPQTIGAGLASATSICGLGTAADEILTYGIVPDGVSQVTILRRDEPDRTVPVINNLYVGATSSTPPLPLRIELHEGSRTVVKPSGIPADVAAEGCREGKPPTR